MKYLLAAATAALSIAFPVAGQDLDRPEGWLTRFDQAGASEADLETFVEMPPGWHVTTGPAGIFWSPERTISGDFRVEMEVFLFDPEGRREAFGVFVGGRDLETDAQAYTYFLIRDGGEFIVKRRDGAQAPTLQGWTAHDAILGYDDRGEDVSVKNVLAIEAAAETVTFFVNDEEVLSLPRDAVDVDGVYGFRVNHRLNLHVSRLVAEPLD